LEKTHSRAVFLDRDGTINRLVYYEDHGFVDSPFHPSQVKLIPGAARAMKMLKKKGFLLVMASNQPGVAKGNMTPKAYAAVGKKINSLLAREGAAFDAEYSCPHHPNAKIASYRKNCRCRKPKPGMLFAAAKEHNISLSRSYMAGDGINDMKAARAAGCKAVFIGNFKPELWGYFKGGKKPDIIAKSLLEAVKKIR